MWSHRRRTHIIIPTGLDDDVFTNECGFSSPSPASFNDQVEIMDEYSDADSDSDGGVSLGDYVSAMSLR